MSHAAITAHAPLDPGEAQAMVLSWLDELGLVLAYREGGLLIAWIDDAIDPGDEGFAGSPSLVVETQIHALAEGVQVRCNVLHGEGLWNAALAAETDQCLRRCFAADQRWVMDNRNIQRQ